MTTRALLCGSARSVAASDAPGWRQAGFTLVEMLLCVAIITLLVGVSLPISQSFVQGDDLNVATQSVVETVRRAQTYARTLDGDTNWSVEFQSGTVTLFKGTNFAGRDTNYDEAYSLPGSVTASGLGEVQFTKFTGIPNTTGTVTLTSTTTSTKTVTVNAKGVVSF